MKSNGKPDCGLLLFRSSGQLSWTLFKKKRVRENGQPSVHRMQHAAPACPRGKMCEGVENADKALEKSGLRVVVARGVHGPINQKRTAHNRTAIYEAPVPAVRAAVSVVAHGK